MGTNGKVRYRVRIKRRKGAPRFAETTVPMTSKLSCDRCGGDHKIWALVVTETVEGKEKRSATVCRACIAKMIRQELLIQDTKPSPDAN